MKFRTYRLFLKLIVAKALEQTRVNDWYELKDINENTGIVTFHMESFDNTIRVEMPRMPIEMNKKQSMDFINSISINDCAKDLANQLLDVLDHYQAATLAAQQREPGEPAH